MARTQHHDSRSRRVLVAAALTLTALGATPVAATMYRGFDNRDDGLLLSAAETRLDEPAPEASTTTEAELAAAVSSEMRARRATPSTTIDHLFGKLPGPVEPKRSATTTTTDGGRAALSQTATTTTKAPVTTTTKAPTGSKAPTTTAGPTGVLVDVTAYGATPGDGSDDQDAIQAALDDAPEGATLVFPAGEYRHRGVLNVRTDGLTLWGYGATLTGTDATSHAVILFGDRTSVLGFTVQSTPKGRLSAEQQMGIALHYTSGSVVRDNTVRNTSSAGIFIWGAGDYVIKNNVVENTMSDGIHSVGGAHDGLVEGNKLRNIGDDCFAVISYVPEGEMSHDITIRNNSCTGGKARGISVAGGVHVLIEGNTIEASAAAGIYLAADASYNTWGAYDVTVRNNTLRGVNTDGAIRHGAIFLWSRSGAATASDGVSYAFDNHDLRIVDNTITDTKNGAADLVAIGSWGARITFRGNVATGSRPYSYLELRGDAYNLVGGTSNGKAVAEHIGDAAHLG